jgi:hypothetical protein
VKAQGGRVEEGMSRLELLAEVSGIDKEPSVAAIGGVFVALGIVIGLLATYVWLFS